MCDIYTFSACFSAFVLSFRWSDKARVLWPTLVILHVQLHERQEDAGGRARISKVAWRCERDMDPETSNRTSHHLHTVHSHVTRWGTANFGLITDKKHDMNSYKVLRSTILFSSMCTQRSEDIATQNTEIWETTAANEILTFYWKTSEDKYMWTWNQNLKNLKLKF